MFLVPIAIVPIETRTTAIVSLTSDRHDRPVARPGAADGDGRSDDVDDGPHYWDDTDGKCAFVQGSDFGGVERAYLNERSEEFGQTFVEETDLGGAPMYTGFITYDAVHIFAEAAREAGSVDSDELLPIIQDISYDGTAGTYEFYDEGHEFPHDVKRGDDLIHEMQFQWQPNGDGGDQVGFAPDSVAEGEYQEPDWI